MDVRMLIPVVVMNPTTARALIHNLGWAWEFPLPPARLGPVLMSIPSKMGPQVIGLAFVEAYSHESADFRWQVSLLVPLVSFSLTGSLIDESADGDQFVYDVTDRRFEIQWEHSDTSPVFITFAKRQSCGLGSFETLACAEAAGKN
jgi:hypothetical protein